MAPTARRAAARRREASKRENELLQERFLDPDWVPHTAEGDEDENVTVKPGDGADRQIEEHREATSDTRSADAPSSTDVSYGQDVRMILQWDADLVPLGKGKRAFVDADLMCPDQPPPAPRGHSTTTQWRNANGKTKKSRAQKMQKSIASIFARAEREPKRLRVEQDQVMGDANAALETSESYAGVSQPITMDIDAEATTASPVLHPGEIIITSSLPERESADNVVPHAAAPDTVLMVVDTEHELEVVGTLDSGDETVKAVAKPGQDDEEVEVEVEAGEEANEMAAEEDEVAVAEEAAAEADNDEEAARTLTLTKALRKLRTKLVNNKKKTAAKLAEELERVSALTQYSKKLAERQQARKEALDLAQRYHGAMRHKLRKRANKIRPAADASAHVAQGRDRGVYFARQLRADAGHVLRTGELPENRQGKGAAHATNFDNPEVKMNLKKWADREVDISEGGLGLNERPTPEKLLVFVNSHLFPRLGIDATISPSTAVRWLKWLGFVCTRFSKGIFWDGHERKDVVAARKAYTELMELSVLPFAYHYEDKTLLEHAPNLPPGTKIHYPIFHDETCFQANDQTNSIWLREGEQELRSKSRGRNVHVSDFIIEKSENGRLALTADEIAQEEMLPIMPLPPSVQAAPAAVDAPKKGKGRKGKTKSSPTAIPVATDCTTAATEDWVPPPPPTPHTRYRLTTYDARQIIYPGANHDPYWDMPQLLAQVKRAIDIFDVKFPDGTAVFIFDCSSAHEAFASDALLAHKMNRNPGGAQPVMHDTKIPGTDTVQSMVFPLDSNLLDDKGAPLAGKVKGMEQVLRERGLLHLLEENGRRPVGTCGPCKQSAAAREKAAKLAKSKADEIDGGGVEGRDAIAAAALAEAEDVARPTNCCMQRLLASQPDFRDEKPLLQVLIEKRGHKCLFLPKFHCEFNPIEMVWGQAKTRFRKFSDGTFPTAQRLVPECLEKVTVDNIRRYFRHCYRYMSAYKIGLNAQQAKYAVKKYSSHRRIPQSIFMDVNIMSRQ
ncbi:hypothetical protein K523DRAFT_414427 [Schizophyllum commune Tattone D]|nr:hypothetical protein K523DRAFT_414427 [Schizophyllum commune Tattone D]